MKRKLVLSKHLPYMVPLPSLMAHWRKMLTGMRTNTVTNGTRFWEKCIMNHLPALWVSRIRYCILFSLMNRSRDTITITTLSPGLGHDAVHVRKQRMVEEAKCISAMQPEDCQGLCVTGSAVLVLSLLCLELVQHVSVVGGSSKCWRLSVVQFKHTLVQGRQDESHLIHSWTVCIRTSAHTQTKKLLSQDF